MYAVMGEELKATEYLLSKGADPNKRDAKGSSAYHFAIINGGVEYLELMEAKGGDARYKNVAGFNGLALINQMLA